MEGDLEEPISDGSTWKQTWDADAGESVDTTTLAGDRGSPAPTAAVARRMAASTWARRGRESSSRPPTC